MNENVVVHVGLKTNKYVFNNFVGNVDFPCDEHSENACGGYVLLGFGDSGFFSTVNDNFHRLKGNRHFDQVIPEQSSVDIVKIRV